CQRPCSKSWKGNPLRTESMTKARSSAEEETREEALSEGVWCAMISKGLWGDTGVGAPGCATAGPLLFQPQDDHRLGRINAVLCARPVAPVSNLPILPGKLETCRHAGAHPRRTDVITTSSLGTSPLPP